MGGGTSAEKPRGLGLFCGLFSTLNLKYVTRYVHTWDCKRCFSPWSHTGWDLGLILLSLLLQRGCVAGRWVVDLDSVSFQQSLSPFGPSPSPLLLVPFPPSPWFWGSCATSSPEFPTFPVHPSSWCCLKAPAGTSF